MAENESGNFARISREEFSCVRKMARDWEISPKTPCVTTRVVKGRTDHRGRHPSRN